MENGKNRVSESNIVHWRSPVKTGRSYKTNSVSRVSSAYNRSSRRRSCASPSAAGGDNGVELKMLDAWKRCLLLFYGGGIPGRREEGRKGGGDLSLNRFAHRMHSRFLEQRTISQGSIYAAWNRRGGEGRRSAYPNSFTYFPLSRKYIRVLSLLSPPSPPLVSWLFHFFSLFLSFFFFFGFSITIAVTFSEFFSTFSLSSFRFLEIGIYRSILCEVCEFFFYYFCLFETRYFKFVKFISNRWNSSLLSGRRVNFLNAREREERFVRERTKRCEISFH